MSTSSRDALARGEAMAWLDTMGPDESEAFEVDTPLGGFRVTLARIGRTVIAFDAQDVPIFGFAPDEATAVEWYTEKVLAFRGQVARMQAAVAEGPGALVNVIMEMVTEGQGQPTPEPVPTSTIPAATRPPVRTVSSEDSGPTGFYL